MYHLQLDKLNQQSIYSFFNDKIMSIGINGTLEWAIQSLNVGTYFTDYVDHYIINEKTQVKFFLFYDGEIATVNVNTRNAITANW
jgi:hypothetical protein